MTDNYEIRPSSDKATGERNHLFAKKHNFPFDKLTIGMSFEVPNGSVPINTLRAAASREGKRLNRNFSVITHPTCHEVAYVSDKPKVAESKKVVITNTIQGIDPAVLAEVNRNMKLHNPNLVAEVVYDEQGNVIKPLWGPGSE